MGGLLLRLRTWWETADRTQKTVTLFGGAFLAFLLLGTFYFASKPKLQTAFTGLSMQDMGKVSEEIAKMGIPYEMDSSGGISIPADKVAEVRAKLAVAGKLPTSGNAADVIGDSSPFEPRDLQQERQRLRLEAQIGDSVKYIEGVESARVKIAPANNSLFVEEKKPATAAVTILEKSGTSLTREQVQAIANLVAYSTPDLDTNHVTVTNQRGQLLWEGMGQESASGVAQKKLTAEIAEAQRRERKLQSMLDQALGAGTTIANVTVVLDFDNKETHESTPTTAENPSSEETAVETMDGSGKPGSGGTIGIEGQGNGQPTSQPVAGVNGSSSYARDQKVKTYPEGVKETSERKATGSVTGMTVTILADSGKLDGQQQALQTIVDGFIGPKVGTDPDNFKSTVEMVKFDTSGADAAKKAAAAGAMGDKIQQVVSLLPILALLVVGFMVVKAISKAAKDQTVLVQALPDGRMIPMAQPLSLGTSTSSAGAAEIVASSEPGALPALKKSKPEIGDIPDNVNVPLEQIKKMSVERPEAVAMLIKSWLLEDRR